MAGGFEETSHDMARWRGRKSRVDFQVSIIVAVVVCLSFACVYFFTYGITYQNMIDSLRERSDSIYEYVDGTLDKETFSTINSRDDMDSDAYARMKEPLETMRAATGVRYLYTAKQADDGGYIYLIDGLPETSSDFRYPGDPIENEIIPDMQRALNNETVYPDDIKSTDWGYIFISYYPVHQDGSVVGVLGIEFDAQSQYEAFRLVRIGTPLIGIAFCAAAVVVALILFRRISNPAFKDLATTDFLTAFKNRNAFEVDTQNWCQGAGESIEGLFSIDLDRLKQVNDTLGHAVGDEYIKAAAGIIAETFGPDDIPYRIGGDEFVICCPRIDEARAEKLAQSLGEAGARTCVDERLPLTLSIGYALRLPGETFEDLLKRADEHMYQMKQGHYRDRSQA